MEGRNTVDFDEEAIFPLLKRGSCDTENAETEKIGSPAPAHNLTPAVIFSTSVSVLGSFSFGTGVSTNPL